MAETKRLYGPPGAEMLHVDIEDAWDVTDGDVIEEWTVHPPRHHLPDAERVAEWIAEWASENGELDEYGDEDYADACMGPAGLAAIGTALDAIAALTHYRMANEHVDTHKREAPDA